MDGNNVFMTGHWEDLIISTFEVDKKILEPYLPQDTEIDLFKGKALMSMVAFTFSKVKFFGVKVPFHQKFGQINFRFYVRSKVDHTKGVVFIKEFAPKPLIASVANLGYNEPYFYKNIRMHKVFAEDKIAINYTFKDLKIKASGKKETQKLIPKTIAHFVVDRYIAYIKNYRGKTVQYNISHRPWDLYKTTSINSHHNVLNLLPPKFKHAKLITSCFVDGSYVTVEKGLPQTKTSAIRTSFST